jgi:hypothetical protein
VRVSCRGIRFEVSKEHWRTDPSAYANLPAKVVGVIEQWRNKREGKIYVEWESDASNSDEHLSVLLQASLDFKLLQFEDEGEGHGGEGGGGEGCEGEGEGVEDEDDGGEGCGGEGGGGKGCCGEGGEGEGDGGEGGGGEGCCGEGGEGEGDGVEGCGGEGGEGEGDGGEGGGRRRWRRGRRRGQRRRGRQGSGARTCCASALSAVSAYRP